MTEFEVRRMAEDIARSSEEPRSKVRALLKIARSLRLRTRALIHARDQSVQARDGNTAAHLDRIIGRLRALYEDVRLEAYRVLSSMRPEVPVLVSA